MEQSAQIQSPVPNEVVRSFYSWYLGSKPAQRRIQSLDSRSDLTDNFKLQLSQTRGGSDALLLCGFEKSDNFDLGQVFTNGRLELVVVSLTGASGSHNIAVEVIDNNNSRQINNILCQEGAADAPATGVPDQAQVLDQPVQAPPAQLDAN
jgi:hypothetical protein